MTSRRMLLAAALSTCWIGLTGVRACPASEPQQLVRNWHTPPRPGSVRETVVQVHNNTGRAMKLLVLAGEHYPRDMPRYRPEPMWADPGGSAKFSFKHSVCGPVDRDRATGRCLIGVFADDQQGNRKVWGFAPGGRFVGLDQRTQFWDLNPDYRVRHVHVWIKGVSDRSVYAFEHGYYKRIAPGKWICRFSNGRVDRYREVGRDETRIRLRGIDAPDRLAIGPAWVSVRCDSGVWVPLPTYGGTWVP